MTARRFRDSTGMRFSRPAHWGLEWATPADVVAGLGDSLLGWWDAERSDLITQSSGAVSSWKDIVAGYDCVQATAANQPTYDEFGFNGAPCVEFNGTSHRLTMESQPFPSGANPSEIWLLADRTATDNTARVAFGYGGLGNQTSRRIGCANTTPVRGRLFGGDGSAAPTVTAAGTFSGRKVLRGLTSATGISIAEDGGALSSPASCVSATGTDRVRIGASVQSTPVQFWQGSIAAILVTAALTDAQATSLWNFLGARV